MNTSPLADVAPGEIAYAAALFMAAADSRLHGSSGLTFKQEQRCQKVYSGLIASDPGIPSGDHQPSVNISLYSVFRQLWVNYRTELDQEAICSRILAFHLLMERTRGDAIQGWTSPIDGEEEQVTLHPAVIGAIGSAPLSPGEGFCQKELQAEIRLHAMTQ